MKKIPWETLKSAERDWKLDEWKREEIFENCINGKKVGRFSLRQLGVPLLYAGTVTACLLAVLFIWPFLTRSPAEKVVYVDGAAAEAKPDVYVEKQEPQKEPAVQVTPSEKENPSTETQDPAPETQDPATPNEQPVEEEKEPSAYIHRFWETEKEMPYEEAVAIVKEKVENRFYEPLTDKERMAYYQCISAFAYAEYEYTQNYYSDSSKDGKKLEYMNPESPNYRTDNPWFEVEIITTKEGVGADFQEKAPLVFEERYSVYDLYPPEIREVTENSYTKNVYIHYMNKEDQTYLEFVADTGNTHNQKLEYGTGICTRSFNFENINILKEKLSKKTIQEIVRYYLSFEYVSWINIRTEDGFKDVETWV